MPLVVKDRVLETSTTTGTGTLTLAGASTGYQTFSSAIGNGNTTYYAISLNGEWEVGIGTVGAGTLSRDTVLESSNAGSLVNFSAGAKQVFCTYPAEKSVDIDTAQTLTNKSFSSSLAVNGSTSGSITLKATDIAGTNTLTLPATTGTIVVTNGGQTVEFADGSASAPSITNSGDTNTGMFFPAADTIAFTEGGTESMRIDSSGNVLVGTTTNANAARQRVVGSSGNVATEIATTGNAVTYVKFYYNDTTNTGNITTNGTTTTYGTTSDYRLKDNVQPMVGALDKVAKLNPVTYTWKSNGFNGQGFIAHELQDIVPDCVTGEKDAVDENNNPIYQNIDTSFLVATLTKAIQELKAIVDEQEEKIKALEAR